uniref:SH3 domain-containing protein n=1 Tax=Mesocestoides corti TaxID=53468 RepID=A0A5K3FDS4_MESCO
MAVQRQDRRQTPNKVPSRQNKLASHAGCLATLPEQKAGQGDRVILTNAGKLRIEGSSASGWFFPCCLSSKVSASCIKRMTRAYSMRQLNQSAK